MQYRLDWSGSGWTHAHARRLLFRSSAQLTGTLTLDAQGNPNAVWVFQIGSTLTTASNSSVVVINGGSSCNVFWQVGSSATLGTDTAFAGNILALTSITLNTGASVSGRALARNGAVTMDTNTISDMLRTDRDRDAGLPGDLCGRFPLRAGRGRRASVGPGADRHPTARPGHTKGCAVSTAGGRQVMRISI